MDMDDPLAIEEEVQSSPRKNSDLIWNILTILGLLGIFIVIGAFGFLFTNPSSGLNPFPPPTLPAAIVLPTSTPTPVKFPATWTPDVTSTPTAVPSTATPTPKTSIATPVKLDEGLTTPTAVSETRAVYPFVLQSEPAAISAVVLHPDRGCGWMGVGGQVLGLQGQPIPGISVQLGGSLDGKVISLTSLTGTVLQYGDAGYEFKISDIPVSTTDLFWVRLVDQANLPLSGRVYFKTFDQCEKNLIVINFKQVR